MKLSALGSWPLGLQVLGLVHTAARDPSAGSQGLCTVVPLIPGAELAGLLVRRPHWNVSSLSVAQHSVPGSQHRAGLIEGAQQILVQ